jgi:hypothetical protein
LGPFIAMKLPRPTPLQSLVLFGLLLAVGLLMPMPITDRALGSLLDSAHGPAFAVLAFLVVRVLTGWPWSGPRRAPWVTCLAIITLGVATEAAQFCVGREFSLKDIATDSLGVVAGTLWAVASSRSLEQPRRAMRIWAVALLALAMTFLPLNLVDTAMQRRAFPVLGSFEHPLERLRWQSWWASLRRSPEHATDGRWSLRVGLRPGEYPGIGTANPIADWSAYRELVFDVAVVGNRPLDCDVIIEDRPSRHAKEDRFERRVRLEPGQQRIVLPLADVVRGPRDRRLDLTRISRFLLVTGDIQEPRTLFLDNLRLR